MGITYILLVLLAVGMIEFSNTEEQGAIKDDLYLLQKKSSYYLIWDESEVLNDIITRYNSYFSPATLENETQFTNHTCPPGEFIEEFELTDPKSCYFQGRRIPEIKFKCTNGSVLDIYKPLKTGHTLQDSKFFAKTGCVGGVYLSIQFTYYVDPVYPYLVQAWGLVMECKPPLAVTDILTFQELVIKAYEGQDLSVLNKEDHKAKADCYTARGICGFQVKVVEEHMSTFEGLYFKVICC